MAGRHVAVKDAGYGAPPASTPHQGRRIVIIIAAMVVLLGGIGYAVASQLAQSVGNNIPRVPGVFGQLPAKERPVDRTATTFLIVGTDSRSPEPTTGTDGAGVQPGSARSDVIMLASVSAERTSAAVVS